MYKRNLLDNYCDCTIEKPNEKELARVYIPFQTLNKIYEPIEALRRGTLFPELYKPYESKRDCCDC